MNIRNKLFAFASVLLTALISFSANIALAQKHYPVEDRADLSTGKYVQQHVIDAGDVPGHKVRIMEVQRIYNDKSGLAVSGKKVTEARVWGYSDYTNGKSKAWGYGVWILEDGNKVYNEWAGSTSSEPKPNGSIEGIFNGVTWLKGGTGKFSSIRGLIADVNHFNNDPKSGYNRSESKGEYWFEE
jgi:hypothetical protein